MLRPNRTISKANNKFPDYLDFSELRKIGLEHIQSLSGDLWTDHNLHDPGITMLEVLSYALLDLGYRTNHDIKDLLAGDVSDGASDLQFYTAAQILGNNPLTPSDYRKLLLDIPGVRNAWLGISETTLGDVSSTVTLNGLYKVLVELDSVEVQRLAVRNATSENLAQPVLEQVKKQLHLHRNLSEDFVEICPMQEEYIGFCAQLELDNNVTPEDALVDMFVRIRQWLSPDPVFYTLQEMLEKGVPIEKIFEGRPMTNKSHGFVDLDELDASRPTSGVLYASDLYRVILDDPEANEKPPIKAVQGLSLYNSLDKEELINSNEWCLELSDDTHPVIDPGICNIVCLKDGIPISFDMDVVSNRFIERLTNARKNVLDPYELDLISPKGIKRNLRGYLSVQREFPAVYGIDEGGLPDSASVTRKAKALQLKGFLLFFDQLLANYLAQLSNIPRFFALKPGSSSDEVQTYFSGNIDSVPELSDLLRGSTFEKEGERITGSELRFQQGETVFYPEDPLNLIETSDNIGFDDYLHFDTPQERDDAITRLITFFEQGEYEIRSFEDECKNNLVRFHTTVFYGQDTPLTLRSFSSFGDYKTVEREAESLTFLLVSPEHFRPIDLQDQNAYTFEIVYSPRPYADFLKVIAESPEQALKRRDRFLDHLLARFAEDFTEYALLQFTSGQRQPIESLIHDKEQFLADYPEISQRRATGFDYTDGEKIWETTNITGLERRVGRLMGIEEWKRRTLAPFAVIENEEKGLAQLIIRDFRGRTLWESPSLLTDHNNFLQRVQEAASNPERLQGLDCDAFSRYGVTLVDDQGCTLATHPDFYGESILRDRKREYLSGIFSPHGPDGDQVIGYDLRCVFEKGGHSFYLRSKTDGRVIFQSPEAQGKDQAQLTWINFSVQATQRENYYITEDAHGLGFGVQVLHNDGETVLGVYPGYFPEREQAASLITETLLMFPESRPELIKDPDSWQWQFNRIDGVPFLRSCHRFTEHVQAGKAMLRALQIASDRDNIHVTQRGDQWAIELHEKHPAQTITLAESTILFDTHAAAEKNVEELCDAVAPDTLFFRKIGVRNHSYQYTWPMSDDDGVLVQGIPLFRTTELAEAGFKEMLSMACLEEQVRIEYEEGFHIRIYDEFDRLIAYHPEIYYDKDRVAEARERLIYEAGSSFHAEPVIEITGQAWYFRLTDRYNIAILESTELYESVSAARAALFEAYRLASMPVSWEKVNEPGFSIALNEPSGRPLARALTSFPTPGERDNELAEWCSWFESDHVPFQVLQVSGYWRYVISMDGEPQLESTVLYETEQEAAEALETALTLATSMQEDERTLCCEQEPGNCLFTFYLYPTFENTELSPPCSCDPPPPEERLAKHPIFYSDCTLCNYAITALVNYLKETRPPYAIEERKNAWKCQLIWETCDERITEALYARLEDEDAEDDKPSADAALSQFLTILEQYDTLKAVPYTSLGDKWTIELDDITGSLVHPHTYNSEEEATCVVEDLKSYIRLGGWQFIQKIPAREFKYRLLSERSSLAVYHSYENASNRDDDLSVLCNLYACEAPYYSTVDTGTHRVIREGNRYRFQLVTFDPQYRLEASNSRSNVLWISNDTFASDIEAGEAFDAWYLDIIESASNSATYQLVNEAGTNYYQLENPEVPGQVLVRTIGFPSDSDLNTEKNKRLGHARCYPYRKVLEVSSEGIIVTRYSFRLGSRDALWSSISTYHSLEEARTAFGQFISALPYPENFYPVAYPIEGDEGEYEYSIEVRQTGLLEFENRGVYDVKSPKFVTWYERKPVGSPPYALVDDSLALVQLTEASQSNLARLRIFTHFCSLDPSDAANNGQNQNEFEVARAWERLEQSLLSLGESTKFVATLDEQHECGFRLLLTGNGYRLARSTQYFHTFQQRERARDGLFDTIRCSVFCPLDRFDDLFDDTNDCFSDGSRIITDRWKFVNEINDPERDALKDLLVYPRFMDLMELARSEDCYNKWREDKVGPQEVVLYDHDGQPFATSVDSFISEDEMGLWIQRSINQAWMYPYIRKDDGFGFQIAEDVDNVILESIQTYVSPQTASLFFCRLLALLKDKSNYIASEEDDCGPFGIDIADPSAIRAWHPAIYQSREEALQAAKRLAEDMDAEGFHVAEHLLMRPLAEDQPTFQVQCEDDLVDPYSFICTVVIPYWGRRFRNTNFRAFFERTLRQETPAHIQLRIAWVTPLQMNLFETAWRAWLEHLASRSPVLCGPPKEPADENDAIQKAEDEKLLLAQLIQHMEALRNTYPPSSRFADDGQESGEAVIILDQTILPT